MVPKEFEGLIITSYLYLRYRPRYLTLGTLTVLTWVGPFRPVPLVLLTKP